MKTTFFILLLSLTVFSNPYPDPDAVPKDLPYIPKKIEMPLLSPQALQDAGFDVIRVDVSFENEKYKVEQVVLERSGTEGLMARSKKQDPYGSYRGELKNQKTGETFYDAVGTGMEMRLLTRGMTFRFPKQESNSYFTLFAENPETGNMEKVASLTVNPFNLVRKETKNPEVRLLKKAGVSPSLKVGIYSEGYVTNRMFGEGDYFFQDAQKVVDALVRTNFPELDRFEIVGVYTPSNTELGKAQDLGLPVKERDSFLGLYFPYWDNFGRWYHIVYPTREKKFRDGIGTIPYDYPIAVINSSDYWGVGNFNELTAIPSRNSSFTYLLTHEFGHYFGLNEEYEGGGKTELAFAPKISEPWSQNITFHPKRGELKWEELVQKNTALPTPGSQWTGSGPWGAYLGGYADTQPLRKSHKPGKNCIMESGTRFCPVCTRAIKQKVAFDLGN